MPFRVGVVTSTHTPSVGGGLPEALHSSTLEAMECYGTECTRLILKGAVCIFLY